jgi:hypothetical protein
MKVKEIFRGIWLGRLTMRRWRRERNKELVIVMKVKKIESVRIGI